MHRCLPSLLVMALAPGLLSACEIREADSAPPIKVAIDKAQCINPAQPILAIVHNASDGPLAEYQFEVSLKQRGHSRVLVESAYSFDYIIAPHSSHSFCIGMPTFYGTDRTVQIPDSELQLFSTMVPVGTAPPVS